MWHIVVVVKVLFAYATTECYHKAYISLYQITGDVKLTCKQAGTRYGSPHRSTRPPLVNRVKLSPKFRGDLGD